MQTNGWQCPAGPPTRSSCQTVRGRIVADVAPTGGGRPISATTVNPLGVRECGTESATRTGRFKDHDVRMHGPCQAVPNLPRLASAGALLGLPRYVAVGQWRMLRHEDVFSMPILPLFY